MFNFFTSLKLSLIEASGEHIDEQLNLLMDFINSIDNKVKQYKLITEDTGSKIEVKKGYIYIKDRKVETKEKLNAKAKFGQKKVPFDKISYPIKNYFSYIRDGKFVESDFRENVIFEDKMLNFITFDGTKIVIRDEMHEGESVNYKDMGTLTPKIEDLSKRIENYDTKEIISKFKTKLNLLGEGLANVINVKSKFTNNEHFTNVKKILDKGIYLTDENVKDDFLFDLNRDDKRIKAIENEVFEKLEILSVNDIFSINAAIGTKNFNPDEISTMEYKNLYLDYIEPKVYGNQGDRYGTPHNWTYEDYRSNCLSVFKIEPKNIRKFRFARYVKIQIIVDAKSVAKEYFIDRGKLSKIHLSKNIREKLNLV